jgi:hypothetical protein
MVLSGRTSVGPGDFVGSVGLTALSNQALAVFHSRITVAGEIFSTSAVSSMLIPPKYRNSTT